MVHNDLLIIILFMQGTIATTITQPVDVMKTRLMEARPGQYRVRNSKMTTGAAMKCGPERGCLIIQ